jgi:hypothetical protein
VLFTMSGVFNGGKKVNFKDWLDCQILPRNAPGRARPEGRF